jgi:hypothetical protein
MGRMQCMAVTLQLARISAALLSACRQSVEELDRLCSFESAPQSDYLDLDWAPAAITRVFELAGVDGRSLAALKRAVDGDAEVNPAYRDHPNTVWEHPVTALDLPAVAEIAIALAGIEPRTVLAAFAEPPSALGKIGAELNANLDAYVTFHFEALRSFYAEAWRRNLAVVLWWD